jgi:hypothetical protein
MAINIEVSMDSSSDRSVGAPVDTCVQNINLERKRELCGTTKQLQNSQRSGGARVPELFCMQFQGRLLVVHPVGQNV